MASPCTTRKNYTASQCTTRENVRICRVLHGHYTQLMLKNLWPPLYVNNDFHEVVKVSSHCSILYKKLISRSQLIAHFCIAVCVAVYMYHCMPRRARPGFPYPAITVFKHQITNRAAMDVYTLGQSFKQQPKGAYLPVCLL